jgi:hypothetical protein
MRNTVRHLCAMQQRLGWNASPVQADALNAAFPPMRYEALAGRHEWRRHTPRPATYYQYIIFVVHSSSPR